MRRSIFDLYKENNTIDVEADRIIKLFEKDIIISAEYNPYNLSDFFDEYCFRSWKQKGHCLDFSDFCSTICLEGIKENAQYPKCSIVDFLTLIELVYNVWIISDIALSEMRKTGYRCSARHGFHLLKTIMDDLLADYNHTIYYDKIKEQALVIEDKQEVTAVAEVIKKELALDVIKYNHRTLKGDLDSKKAILISLYHELEPKRPKIKDFNNKLEENLFYICNNLDMRHNNVDNEHTRYKEFVANMNTETLEEWYDELYQMMLLAFLAIDDIENRRQKVNQLKRQIDGQ